MSHETHEIDSDSVRPLLPARPADGHKGVFGHLLIVAGSRGYTGAAHLCTEAALRSGVGLVTLATPKSLGDIAATVLREAMTLCLPETQHESVSLSAAVPALRALESRTAAVLGPGISQHADTKAFVREFVPQCTKPLLIDADGLNALGHRPEILSTFSNPCVLTPHPGEMSRLTGLPVTEIQSDRVAVASTFATTFRCVLVLKGSRTVVAEPDGQVHINTTGNAGLAKGGTGDVLAGLIGGLLAQGMLPGPAARLGVYLHGLAGDYAARAKTPRGMVAGDVIESLPDAWKHVEEPSAS